MDLEAKRREACKTYSCDFVDTRDQDKVGVALSTLGLRPINGLRHPPSGETSGWYVWCGETLSNDADFFASVCATHVVEKLPEVSQLLGLPPGYRFLIDGV